MTNEYIAHVRFTESGKPIEHWLDEHLRDVGEMAATFAEFFGKDWAETASNLIQHGAING